MKSIFLAILLSLSIASFVCAAPTMTLVASDSHEKHYIITDDFGTSYEYSVAHYASHDILDIMYWIRKAEYPNYPRDGFQRDKAAWHDKLNQWIQNENPKKELFKGKHPTSIQLKKDANAATSMSELRAIILKMLENQ